jgi:serine/threonine protein phosphatase 1
VRRSAVAIVGDIHGEADVLERLLERIEGAAQRIVFVGDYVDRGSGSARVVASLLELARRRECTFLAGNHDLAFRRVLDGGGLGPHLRLGGAATLSSYLGGAIEADVATQLRRTVPTEHYAFFRSLAERYEIGGELLVTHAPQRVRSHGFQVAGHVPQATREPSVTASGALIDTGCGTWRDGRLTCLLWPSRTWIQELALAG